MINTESRCRAGAHRSPIARAAASRRRGGLIVLAFTEKLSRPDLALAFVDEFPFVNILKGLGLGIGDLEFVRVAGAIELLFGLLIISGALPQAAMIVARIPFNATLFFFGASELVGHLPIYGVMLALLIYGSSTRYAQVVSRLSVDPPAKTAAAISGTGR